MYFWVNVGHVNKECGDERKGQKSAGIWGHWTGGVSSFSKKPAQQEGEVKGEGYHDRRRYKLI